MSGPPPTSSLFPLPELEAAPSSVPVTPGGDEAPVILPMRRPASPRVLHVINGEHYSGAERVQDLLAMRLPEFGYTADFAALKSGRFGEARLSTKARLTTVPMRSRFDFRVVGDLKKLIQKHGYQLLHAHTPRTALITAIVARSLDLPWIYHVHSPVSMDSGRPWQNRINAMVERFSLQSAARVIVVSPTLLSYMESRAVEKSRLVCVPNGVPVCHSPLPASPAGEPLVVGMVALFRPRKGTEVLLQAVANLVSRGVGIRLRLIGGFETPEYQAQIHRLVEQLDIDNHVEFAGFTAHVMPELMGLDVMVLPSLYGEGLPMVVLEAMSAGVPVVASSVEGATTAIEHRQSGLLVEPGSVSQLAAAIEEFATGAVDYNAMASAARARHRQQFSDETMARGVAKVYTQALSWAGLST